VIHAIVFNKSLPKIGIYLSVLTKRLIEPLEKEEVDFISLDKVISDLDGTSNYFLDLFNNKGFDLGILRLRKGELDSQLPHPVNEVYFVVEGNGFIDIKGELKPVKRADFIFVAANVRHRFIVDDQDLIVIYFFPSLG
jgi:mannose-6-phosphate isomerase-like protein (cupin superfamily)